MQTNLVSRKRESALPQGSANCGAKKRAIRVDLPDHSLTNIEQNQPIETALKSAFQPIQIKNLSLL